MSFKKTAWGTAMISSVRLLRLVSQFVAIPILARLLTPEEYGLVAIAMPFALFAMMIADAGIGMSLVRTPASERVVWSTCFWLSIILGVALALVMAGLSPLAADIFNQPQLVPMMLALAFVVLAQAIHLIPVAALQQAQRFKTIALVDIFATALGLGTAVYMAYHGYGAWALIGQQIAVFSVKVSLVCLLSPFRPLMKFNWPEVREHMQFGRNVLGNSLVTYFTRSGDNWIVGKMLGATLVGFYSMAFMFARLPQQIVAGPLQFVMYAQLAKMKDNPAGIARIFLLMTRILAILIFPAMGLIAAAHVAVFSLLLSEKWLHAGAIYLLLAPACAAQAVIALSETIMFAMNRTDIQLRTSSEYAVIWIGALLVFSTHGVEAAAITFSVVTLLYQWRYLSIMLPLIGVARRDYFATYLIPLVATGLGIVAYIALTTLMPMAHWAASILAALIAVTAVLGSALVQKNSLMDGIRQWGGNEGAPPNTIQARI